MRVAEAAVIINTDGLEVDEVVTLVLQYATVEAENDRNSI
jgi:hypothetical protein